MPEQNPTPIMPASPNPVPPRPAPPMQVRPQPHGHKAIYFVIAIIFMVAVGAGLLIYIQNYKTAEDLTVSSTPDLVTSCSGENASALRCSQARLGSVIKTWKIYSNKTYGLAFRYPPAWKVSQSGSVITATAGDGSGDALGITASANQPQQANGTREYKSAAYFFSARNLNNGIFTQLDNEILLTLNLKEIPVTTAPVDASGSQPSSTSSSQTTAP